MQTVQAPEARGIVPTTTRTPIVHGLRVNGVALGRLLGFALIHVLAPMFLKQPKSHVASVGSPIVFYIDSFLYLRMERIGE